MSLSRFSDPAIAKVMLETIHKLSRTTGPVKIMEVCGTHTMEIGRLGLRPLLPASLELVSGPGCPVCVTPGSVIDAAVTLAVDKGVSVLTFGDMIKVPGERFSLAQAAARGASVTEIVSALHVVNTAAANPSVNYVFVAVGFETTIPVVARTIMLAEQKELRNLHFLVSHRLVPPALDALIADTSIGINAFLLPGHASAIIGERVYARLPQAGIPGAITGFESLDVLSGIQSVMTMLAEHRPAVTNCYTRVVRPEGNPNAVALIGEVFEPVDAMWRGIGVIPRSGLALRERFARFDAAKTYGVSVESNEMPEGCSCGSVLKGIIHPDQCPLFGTACTPDSPVGPCMVSTEGSCAAYFRYEVPRV